jgi:hypothetical protein
LNNGSNARYNGRAAGAAARHGTEEAG